jgi:hypothetical protein
VKGLKLDIAVGALVAKHVEFFEEFDLLGFRTVRNEEDLLDAKGTGASDDIADIFAFADVVEEEIAFGFFRLH